MDALLGFCLTFAVGTAGFLIARLCKVPNPALLGSVFATGILNLAGYYPDFPTWFISLAANLLIGMMIGRQIDRNVLLRIMALARPVFVQTALILGLSVICGCTLHFMGGGEIDLLTSFTAIAAVAPVIGAKDEEIGYSISVVFLFNLAAIVIFPPLGQAMDMTPETFGVWAGTAVNDTSSVMATSIAYSDASVPIATLVKMTRTVMIVPMALLFSVVAARRAKREAGAGGNFSFVKVFPWFVPGFLLMSLWTTWGGLPADWASFFRSAGKFLITIALSGIGLNTNIRKILATSARPILLGLRLWFTVAALALALINLR